MLPVALQRRRRNHVVQHGGNHVVLLDRGQRALHDFRVVQHVVDLTGQALSRHFDGGHVRPDVRRQVLSQGHLADPDDHVDGSAELVGHVGEEDGVLLPRRLQFPEHAGVPRPLGVPAGDPVPGQHHPAEGHDNAQPQAEYVLALHSKGNGVKDKAVIQHHQPVQGRDYIYDPLFIQHEQHEDQDAGHSGGVKQAGLVDAEEKELRHHQRGAQVLIHRVRAEPPDMQQPHADAAGNHQRNHPELPGPNQGDHAEHEAGYGGDDGQEQVPACLFLRPHAFSSSWSTRFSSSWGR